MEPPEDALRKDFRLILNLGKYRVIERQDQMIKIALGGSTTMTCTIPPQADVAVGDILTFYTEVLYANPRPPPVN